MLSIFEDGDSLFIWGSAVVMVPLGLAFGGTGLWLLRSRPRAFVLGEDGLSVYALPLWKPRQEVAYADIVELKHVPVPNLGMALGVQTRDGRLLQGRLQRGVGPPTGGGPRPGCGA